jgi:two-component system, OmpR family, phosphate regulon sensor histidine kinase PhoR
MPDVDGLQVLKQIRDVHPNTVCFIATGYPGFDTATESAKLGAFNYIPKPFTPEELLSNLKQGYDRRLLLLEAEKWKREREESLLEVAFEKTRLNTIINSITDGILVINKHGQAVLFNPSALIFLQLSKIDIEEYIIDKLHPKIAKLVNKFLSKNVYEKKSYSAQIELKPNENYLLKQLVHQFRIRMAVLPALL